MAPKSYFAHKTTLIIPTPGNTVATRWMKAQLRIALATSRVEYDVMASTDETRHCR